MRVNQMDPLCGRHGVRPSHMAFVRPSGFAVGASQSAATIDRIDRRAAQFRRRAMVLRVPDDGAARVGPVDAAGRKLFRVTPSVGAARSPMHRSFMTAPFRALSLPTTFAIASATRNMHRFSISLRLQGQDGCIATLMRRYWSASHSMRENAILHVEKRIAPSNRGIARSNKV